MDTFDQNASLRSEPTRRIDFALFMLEAFTNDGLIQEAPAIVGCQTPSALAHAASAGQSNESVKATQR
jgi:hypothetical protein